MTDEGAWITIVVRAWADVGGTRIRLLRVDSAGGRDHRVVASIDQAAATLTTWLRPMDRHRDEPATRARRGADAAGDDNADGQRRRS
jgi:hypothetical protein